MRSPPPKPVPVASSVPSASVSAIAPPTESIARVAQLPPVKDDSAAQADLLQQRQEQDARLGPYGLMSNSVNWRLVRLRDDELNLICAAIQVPPNVISLSFKLSLCPLGDVGVYQAFARALFRLTTSLVHLHLEGCSLGNDGAASVAQALPRSLVRLELQVRHN